MEATTQAGITRRGFLKTTALVAGAATAAGLAGCQNLSEAPQEEVKAEAEGTQTPTQPAPASTPAVEEQTYRNICRGNCGGSNVCHLLAKVREGKIVHVMAEELEGEAGVIQAGCLKAATNPQRIYSSHRLLYPMVQKGERGSDNWERISWDEAFELMAEKLQAAFDEYGPESVGISGYGGNSIEHLSKTTFGFINNSETRPKNSGVGIERFVQKTGMTLFGGSGDLAQLYMQMTILQAAGNSAEDLVNSKTIFLWGSNPADATRYAWPHVVAAQEAGAKVIAIDPRFSNSAAHADMWIPIRPGTDGALVLAMCNYIVDNDLIDYDYLRNHSVAPLLVKEDGSYLRLSDLGRDPIEVTDAKGNTTSVDCEVVYDEANQTFGASREVTDPAVLGTFDAEGISVRTVYDYALEAIKPYTVEFAANECGIPQEKIAEITELYAKNTPAALAHWWGMEHFANSWRMYYGIALLASLTGNACKPGAGYSPFYGMSSAYKKPVKQNFQSLVLEDAKPNKMFSANRIPEIVETGEWMGEKINLRALFIMGTNPMESCVDYNTLAEAYSKIDFVVVHDQFMTDTVKWASLALPCTMSWENEDFNGAFMAQKAIDPVGEGKSNFEVFVGLADAMGYDDLFDKDAEGYLREILDTPENIEAGVAYDDYHEKGAIKTDFTLVQYVGQETNPTGRTQFYLETLPLRDYPGVATEMGDRLPSYEHAFEAYADNPLREKYPLYGMNYHDNYSGQSMHSHVPWLNELRGYEGEPYILISEPAAEARGIKTGDKVRTFNDRGYVVTRAVVTKGLQEDTVVVPRGYGEDEFEDGNVHTLSTIGAVDRVCSNDSHNDWLCQVEKI